MGDKCKRCNGKGYLKNYGDNPRIPKFVKCPSCLTKSSNKEHQDG